MDYIDKKIMESEIAAPIGKAVSQWVKKNDITDPVSINATVARPTCYVDEQGLSHSGPLVVCNVQIINDDLDDEDFED